MPWFLLAAVLLVSVPGWSQQTPPLVYRIPVTGTIENGLAPYVARVLREAKAAGAAAAILDIDTPGGRVDAAERIVDAINDAGLPVYAFVNPRAYSAGAMIALAAEAIYLRPGGVIGAATPVDGQGVKASEKIVSAMRAAFRGLAEARGLDPRIAEGMVDESVVIDELKPAGKLLTLTADEAIRVGYARAVVPDLPAVLASAGLAGATVETLDLNWAEHVVRFLTNPLVSPLLLSLGMLGIIFEIKSGHFGLGGLVSLLSLGAFFGSGVLIGLAGWEEIILLGLGFVALGIEAFVLPGFGVAGVLGLGLLGASIVLAMVSGLPTGADFVTAAAILGAAIIITICVVFAWIRHLPNSLRFRRIMLQDGLAPAEGYISAPPRDDLVGQTGTAITDLRPAGVATIGEERVDVVTEGDYLANGTPVTVIRSEGYRHVVRAAGN